MSKTRVDLQRQECVCVDVKDTSRSTSDRKECVCVFMSKTRVDLPRGGSVCVCLCERHE